MTNKMNHNLLLLGLIYLAGCKSPVNYSGEGVLSNTSYSDYGRHTRYSIKLTTVALNTNLNQTFFLGNLAFFEDKTRMFVHLEFEGTDLWWRSSDKIRSQNPYIDDLKSRLKYEIKTDSGTMLFQSDHSIAEYTWGQTSKGNHRNAVDIYNSGKIAIPGGIRVPKNQALYLSLSYVGDPLLTNRADIVVRLLERE